MQIPNERIGARVRVRAGAAIVLVLAALAVGVLVTAFGSHGSTELVEPSGQSSSARPTGFAIFVHVLGAVERAGLYELNEGDRVVDAIAAAGGFSDVADQTQLNLARPVTDGEQVRVLAIGEVQPGASAPGDGRVNLNSADVAALDTLPRVGPALAERIIAWREANGPFTVVEDLLSVSGIGDKTFEGLRELVTV